MADVTDWGFPKGQVAQALRKILYPDLTDHEVETIIVCLMSHLLIENRINDLLYRWLRQDAPRPNKDDEAVEAEDALWKNIAKIDFAKKYSLVEPFFAVLFPNEAGTPWKINELRNAMGDSYDEARRLRVVVQRVADLPHRNIDSVVGIQEDLLAPHALEDFLARHELPAPVGKNEEHVQWNALQLHGTALAAELVGTPVKLKFRKTADIRRHPNPL